jgi:hypothetical protein
MTTLLFALDIEPATGTHELLAISITSTFPRQFSLVPPALFVAQWLAQSAQAKNRLDDLNNLRRP